MNKYRKLVALSLDTSTTQSERDNAKDKADKRKTYLVSKNMWMIETPKEVVKKTDEDIYADFEKRMNEIEEDFAQQIREMDVESLSLCLTLLRIFGVGLLVITGLIIKNIVRVEALYPYCSMFLFFLGYYFYIKNKLNK